MDEVFTATDDPEQALADHTASPRSLSELLDERDRLSRDRGALYNELEAHAIDLNDVVGMVSESDPQLWGQIVDACNGTDAEPHKEEWGGLMQRLQGIVGDEKSPLVRKFFSEDRALVRELESIEHEALEPAKAQLVAEQEWFLSHTNWDKALDKYGNTSIKGPDDPDYLGQLIQLTATENIALTSNLQWIVDKLHVFESCHQLLNDSDMLLEMPLEAENENLTRQSGLDSMSKTDRWLLETRSAIRFVRSGERRAAIESRMSGLYDPQSPFARISRLAMNLGMYPSSGQTVPKVIYKGIVEKFDRIMADFDAADAATVMEASQVHPNMITFVGEDLLRASTTIENPRRWTARQLRELPDFFCRGLGFVRYVDEIVEDSIDSSGTSEAPSTHATLAEVSETDGGVAAEIWPTYGHFIANNNEITVSARHTTFNIVLTAARAKGHTGPDFEYALKSIQTDAIRGALYHEAGHYAVVHTLPMAILRRWAHVLGSEDVDVTEYVTKKRSELSSALADEEDFCESLKLYMTDPVTLLWKAPKRFSCMHNLIGRYDDESIYLARHVRQRATPETQALEQNTVKALLHKPFH